MCLKCDWEANNCIILPEKELGKLTLLHHSTSSSFHDLLLQN